MKALIQFLWVVALGMLVTLVVVWTYLGLHAVGIFNVKMSALAHRKVSIRAIYPVFPLGVVGKGLEIEGLGTVGKVRADIDGKGLFRGDFNISSIEISDPVIVLERDDTGGFHVPAARTFSGGNVAHATAGLEILFHQVTIHNGTLSFGKKEGKALTIDKIEAHLTNVPLAGQPVRTDFLATVSFPGGKFFPSAHFVKIQGWLNWAERDMDAKVEARSDDGLMRMKGRLVSRNNDLLVNGKISVSGGNSSRVKDAAAGVVENVVRDVLGASQTDIDANFSFRTQMDHFEIGPISLKGNITTGLNSSATSGTIVQSLKAIGEQFLKDDAVTPETK